MLENRLRILTSPDGPDEVVILGCGTSGGVPKVPEYWGNCDPHNPKNRRRRASILLKKGTQSVLIDTSPDLREQALSAGLTSVSAVLYTHDHADHVHGIDDLRGFYHASGQKRLPVYSNAETIKTVSRRFDYVFHDQDGYPALCNAHVIGDYEAFDVAGMVVQAFEQQHGYSKSLGFRVGDMAYSTDLNGLSDQAKDLLKGLDLWIVDALRIEPHPTHAHLDMTLKWIDELKPKQAILTHLDWTMDYKAASENLPPNVSLAYDGMKIFIA